MTSAILTPTAPSTQRHPVTFRTPTVDDGGALWRIATDAKTLDVNTSYAYLLWCRDFAQTSIVAEIDGTPGGFVTGYTRPDDPETLMIWQVAVDDEHRGCGIARAMLEELTDRVSQATMLETTITDDNDASIALFSRYAERRDAALERTDLFEPEHFPDGHDAERLYRVSPLR